MLKYVLVPIHKEGYPFIAIFALIGIGLGFVAQALGFVGLVLTLWCVYFFRDPPRVTPIRDGLMISPADGEISLITEVPPPPELDMGSEPRTRVSVFMSVFNVHVNRVPLGGKIAKIAYIPGKFLNATLDKASSDNERLAIRLTLADGREIAFVQIAGLIARRIKCFVKEGDEMKTGQRFGLIRFGSRVDIYLPHGVNPMVALGQTMLAGETVIADLNSQEAQRKGEIL